METERSRDDVDPAVPLDGDESVTWTGRPRITLVLPAVVAGLGLVLAGAIVTYFGDTLVALTLVPAGLAVPVWRYLVNRNTQYVVTDRALYVKHGVLSRSVTQATLDTVQNSSYAQGVTGSLFGYGAVEFEVAGGRDLAFRAVDHPREVRALVDRATGDGGITGTQPRTPAIPGRLEQWQRIRDEARSIRRVLERRD